MKTLQVIDSFTQQCLSRGQTLTFRGGVAPENTQEIDNVYTQPSVNANECKSDLRSTETIDTKEKGVTTIIYKRTCLSYHDCPDI